MSYIIIIFTDPVLCVQFSIHINTYVESTGKIVLYRSFTSVEYIWYKTNKMERKIQKLYEKESYLFAHLHLLLRRQIWGIECMISDSLVSFVRRYSTNPTENNYLGLCWLKNLGIPMLHSVCGVYCIQQTVTFEDCGVSLATNNATVNNGFSSRVKDQHWNWTSFLATYKLREHQHCAPVPTAHTLSWDAN